MNPKVDAYLRGETQWKEETRQLIELCRSAGLGEEIKWGKPCYTFQETNVVILQGFKAYCALLFCKGALLKDPNHILHRIGEHTQGARQARFTDVSQIIKMKPVLKAYIKEAVAAEKAGLKVVYKKTPEPIPAELQERMDRNAVFKKAFFGLTPGRQRAYILFISSAKQTETRAARVAKFMPQIIAGKGLND
ncbi:MAG TPA: DUF1801 domain-containing protein [Opitutaceae bacterium]|jgi:uncharacterized protein YdeI (YjbR/CyaY-like superfamily)|nr:DUF1801 domain-containing protein [Opitutaceae bacterium]